MGKYDRDRFQKELAIRYCLAKGAIPLLEVVILGVADLSDTVEIITDIDVLGIEYSGDGDIKRTIFDCKTSNKMSAINRAFWAAGLKTYTGCDDAFVILKNKPVYNHRVTALSMNVDLHDEVSFSDLGKTFDISFPSIDFYQSSIDGWNLVFDAYEKNRWSETLFEISRNLAPISKNNTSIFRKIIAELRSCRGNFDPAKISHVSIFFDVLASTFILWGAMGKEIRRFYEPTMKKEILENTLRYYMWGGKESYNIRQQIRERSQQDSSGWVELPAWDQLFKLCGLIVSSPQSLQGCAHICRELSIRCLSGPDIVIDAKLAAFMKKSTRYRQFIIGMAEYFVAASGLPRDLGAQIQKAVFEIKV